MNTPLPQMVKDDEDFIANTLQDSPMILNDAGLFVVEYSYAFDHDGKLYVPLNVKQATWLIAGEGESDDTRPAYGMGVKAPDYVSETIAEKPTWAVCLGEDGGAVYMGLVLSGHISTNGLTHWGKEWAAFIPPHELDALRAALKEAIERIK